MKPRSPNTPAKAKAKAMVKRTRKLSQVENLGLLATPFGQALRALALTCDHFGRDQICTQVNANFLPFGHPTQVSSQVQFAATYDYLRIRLTVKRAEKELFIDAFIKRPFIKRPS